MAEIRFSCSKCHKAMRTTNVGLAGKLVKCPDCGGPVRVPPEATSEDLPVPSAQGEQRIRPISRQTLERPEAEESAIREEPVHGRERRAKSGGDAARQWRRSDDDLRPRPPEIRKPVDVVAVVVAAVAILYIAMLVFFAVGAFDSKPFKDGPLGQRPVGNDGLPKEEEPLGQLIAEVAPTSAEREKRRLAVAADEARLIAEFRKSGNPALAPAPAFATLRTGVPDAKDVNGIGQVFLVAFSPDAKLLAVNRLLKKENVIWEVGVAKVPTKLAARGLGPMDLVFSPDGRTLFSVDGAALEQWDVATGRQERIVTRTGAHRLLLTPGGKMVITGGAPPLVGNPVPTLKIWDLSTGRLLLRLYENFEVTNLAVTPDGKTVISAHVERSGKFSRHSLLVWGMPAGTQKGVIPLSSDLRDMVLTPDGLTLVLAGSEAGRGMLTLRDLATRNERNLVGQEAPVAKIAVSPDGKYLASCDFGAQSAISLWDIQQTKRLRVVANPPQGERVFESRPTALAFSPGGTLLAVGMVDGGVKLLVVSELLDDRAAR